MNELRPRRRLPLEALRGLNQVVSEPRWRHRVVDVDAVGRITLPADARGVVDGSVGTVRAASQRLALVLARGDGDASGGVELRVDARRRLLLPAWIRRLAEPEGSVLLSTRRPDGELVVVTPASALDAVADSVVGEGVA